MEEAARPGGYLAAALGSVAGYCPAATLILLIFLDPSAKPEPDAIGYPIVIILAIVAGWPLAICSCWWTLRARAYPHAVGTVGWLLILLPPISTLLTYCFTGVVMLVSATPFASYRAGMGIGLWLSQYGWFIACVLANLAAIVAASVVARWLARASAGLVAQLAADLPG